MPGEVAAQWSPQTGANAAQRGPSSCIWCFPGPHVFLSRQEDTWLSAGEPLRKVSPFSIQEPSAADSHSAVGRQDSLPGVLAAVQQEGY